MQITVCVTVDVPSTQFSDIEEASVQASRAAARQAMAEACRRIERSRGPKARRARHGRKRSILTRAGYITITRGRARGGATSR